MTVAPMVEPGTGPVEAVVVVPTFRRPRLLERTLASLAGQVTKARFAIVVVENDPGGGEGRAVAHAMLAAVDRPGIVVDENNQGNVHAINAGFSAALDRYPSARFMLMIDDDEQASPHWLDTMVSAADATGADVVGGPVFPVAEREPPPRLIRHPVYWPPFSKSGPVPMIYGSGNCLIHRSMFDRLPGPYFDPRFNYLGGGDTDFFNRCRLAGARFHYEAAARVTETVPQSRLTTTWLIQRGLRTGAINRALDAKASAGWRGTVRLVAKDTGILVLSPLRGLALALRTGVAFAAFHPALVAFGRLASIAGVEPEQYKAGPP